MTSPEPPPAPARPSLDELVAELRTRRQEALMMGGEEAVRRHHQSGRLTARERIELLVDPDSFLEIGLLAKPERRLSRPMSGDGGGDGFRHGRR
ncbi:MAG: hypothetical protein KatS3mg011_2251 [Acidimicrobiia bacterium]|nr:MAG: hypothetical protein KatS3mg011_2251 [Acidimicrobiia bacterium]